MNSTKKTKKLKLWELEFLNNPPEFGAFESSNSELKHHMFHEVFSSFTDAKEEWIGDYNNRLIDWAWWEQNDESCTDHFASGNFDNPKEGDGCLVLIWHLPRKDQFVKVLVKVEGKEEAAVREYLKAEEKNTSSLWENL